MSAPEIIREKLDDMCARLELGRDVVDHDALIKAAWRRDPFKWARERLKLPMRRWSAYAPQLYREHKWDGTPEPLYTTAKEVAAGNNVAVFSGTGTGKTYLGAIIVLWWLDCWEGSQVITVAPKKEQLNRHIWKEISKLWPLFQRLHPRAEFLTGSLEIRMRGLERKDWFATGFVCGVAADEAIANKARGFHAEHMLFLLEETTGIHPSILMAIKLTCTGPHNLRLFFGNPDSIFDGLSRAAEEPGVVRIRASALDHPNIVAQDPHLIPGAQSQKILNEWREEWGEESPLYQSRVRGIPPAQDAHALIRVEWIKAAQDRYRMLKQDSPPLELLLLHEGPAALGVDVANSEDGDKAAIAYGRGRVLREVKSYKCPDANEFARLHVYPYVDSGMVEEERVGVDIVGVGVGCFNELKRLNCHVQGLNGGRAIERKTHDPEPVKNLRSKMYWQMRTDLQHGNIALPDDDPELVEDLLAPTWKTQNGVIIVESKEDFKKRLPDQRSPDKGDAAVYWNWVRQARAGLDFGGDSASIRGPVAF